MPVHRNPGARGRVWAYEGELRTWLIAQQAPPPRESPFRRYLLPAAAGVLIVFALVAFGIWHRSAGLPASIKTDGLSLIVSDDQGVELWRRRLPFEHYVPAPPAQAERLQWALLDLTGDANPEVLFPLRGNDQKSQNSLLLCYSHDGKLLWQYEPGRTVKTAEETHIRTYHLLAMAVVSPKAGGPRYLALVSTQTPNYLSHVTLLDSSGHLVREYWHSGHLDFLTTADLDSDGTPELILTGIANGYSAATLVVLDPFQMAGASREERPRFQVLGQGAPVERARLLFPRTRANLVRQKYNYGHGVLLGPDHLIVTVEELTADICGISVNYLLSLNLELRDVQLGDSARNCYQTLYAARLMPALLDPQDELPELRKIKVLTPWH